MDEPDAAAVAQRCLSLFGDPTAPSEPPSGGNYAVPPGYPRSLALCIVDSIQSTGVRYPSVVAVVNRYREYRRAQDADPDQDGAEDLLQTFSELNGTAGWAARIGNQHRTSTQRDAPLKAEAVRRSVEALVQRGVLTSGDLREVAGDPTRTREVESSWRSTVGQRSGITWHYVQMLAGVPGVKPDRMIIRFVADSLGAKRSAVTPAVAGALVTEAAARLGASPTALDHKIWQWQRSRPTGSGKRAILK